MITEKILKEIDKIKQDRKQAEDEMTRSISGAAEEKPQSGDADLPGSLSEEQVADLSGGGRPGNPCPPH